MLRLFTRAFTCGHSQNLVGNLILARLSNREPSRNLVGEHPCWVRIGKTMLADGLISQNNVYVKPYRTVSLCIDLQKSRGVDVFIKNDHKDITEDCINMSKYPW